MRLQLTETGLRGTNEHLALAAEAARLAIWVRDVSADEAEYRIVLPDGLVRSLAELVRLADRAGMAVPDRR